MLKKLKVISKIWEKYEQIFHKINGRIFNPTFIDCRFFKLRSEGSGKVVEFGWKEWFSWLHFRYYFIAARKGRKEVDHRSSRVYPRSSNYASVGIPRGQGK